MTAARVHQLAALALVTLILVPQRVAGQASESEMAGFPMPPPSGYFATKTFGYVGDYGYYTAPGSAVPGTGATASDYRYVRYSGVAGKRVFVQGHWGPTSIPPASGGGDACAHTHVSYGVWARWQFVFPQFGFPFGVPWWPPLFFLEGWSFLGGGGMSGVRDPAGTCVHATENPLTAFDPRYGWGTSIKSYDLRSSTFITDLVVGALSNTHGWGSCTVPPGAFPACHEPSYIIEYTLP